VANVLLGATGSVAAIRVPLLFEQLSARGYTVKVVATKAATYFFDPAPLREQLTLDADEWPGERYTRGDEVRHIELRRWADLFLLAPLDANTLAKLAVGLCDNCLTCVWRAWDWAKPVVLAPAMNTIMWRHPFTRKHLKSLAADFGAAHIPGHFDEETLIRQINDRAKTLHIVAPIEKMLACGDVGTGAMAEVSKIVTAVEEMAKRISG
jgi:phosphopantothenoylcysteine decarboxylase